MGLLDPEAAVVVAVGIDASLLGLLALSRVLDGLLDVGVAAALLGLLDRRFIRLELGWLVLGPAFWLVVLLALPCFLDGLLDVGVALDGLVLGLTVGVAVVVVISIWIGLGVVRPCSLALLCLWDRLLDVGAAVLAGVGRGLLDGG